MSGLNNLDVESEGTPQPSDPAADASLSSSSLASFHLSDLFPASLVNVAVVDNAREQVERNVEQGSRQCMQNFVCQNGGRCVQGSFGGFRCLCKPPFFGVFCENTCPKPCHNGGRCLKLRVRQGSRDGGGAPSGAANDGQPASTAFSGARYVFRCVCPRQYDGELCERKVQT
jgi:hypothetical protein